MSAYNLKRGSTIMTLVALALVIRASAETISEDFEAATAGVTNTPPAGWQISGSVENGYYVTSPNLGNPNKCAFLDWTGTTQVSPGIYMVNSGAAFDATKAISGSFHFFVNEEGNYSTINFILGDVQDGLVSSAGAFINVYLDEIQFGSRAQIYDGAGGLLFNGDGNNTYTINSGQWCYDATFTWTPTNGTTGDFSFSWKSADGTQRGPMTVTGYTFDNPEVYFGFGTGKVAGRFDNISITGSTIAAQGTLICIQ